MKYYMAYDKDNVVWGLGLTRSKAKTDAKHHLSAFYGSTPYHPLKFIECTCDFYNQVIKEYDEEEHTWHVEDNIAVLDSETYKRNKKEAVSCEGNILLEDFEKLETDDKLSVLFSMLNKIIRHTKPEKQIEED